MLLIYIKDEDDLDKSYNHKFDDSSTDDSAEEENNGITDEKYLLAKHNDKNNESEPDSMIGTFSLTFVLSVLGDCNNCIVLVITVKTFR